MFSNHRVFEVAEEVDLRKPFEYSSTYHVDSELKTMEKAKVLAENGADIILIDAPLLFESGFDSFCACTVCVTAPEETVIRRIMRRDGISEEDAGKRLAVQKPAAELREKSDFEIVNDADRETILERVEAAAEKIRSLYIKTEK